MAQPNRDGPEAPVEVFDKPEAHAFDLFVVHAAADADFVRGYLLPALNLPPARVLLFDALPLGGVVVAEIERGVSRSRFTIAVLSPAYLADCWAVFGEQLASHLSGEDVRVIPLRLTDCELPLRLDARIPLDFRDPVRWESEAARLRARFHTAESAGEPISCPYPGMRPFAEDDASWFFGRDEEIDDLVGRLDRDEREIYVIGPSGSGKSSLVQAGLLHVLDTGASRLGRSFVARALRPGERPTDRLSKILEGDLATPAATLEAFVTRQPPAKRALVFVDQLEELFTLAGTAERQRFIATLRVLRAEPRCHLLLALRADFYGALMDSPLWPARGGLCRLDVAPLRGTALAQAIRAPALRVGVHLDPRLSDRVVAEAAEEPGALPLMQETLRLLWDRRRQRYLGLAEYEALGNGRRGLDVAIARRADTAMAALTAAQQMIARRILLRLVSFGEGRADTRRQQDVNALRSAVDAASEFSEVLKQLVEHRLVTVDGAETDQDALVDLSHEALITAWPVLGAWIDQRRADEQRRRRLEAKVSEWIERGQGTASLLDAAEFAEATHWMHSDAARELGYSADLPALVTASRSEIEKLKQQQRQRTLRAFITLAVFSLVASVLGIVAWHQRQDARLAAEAQQFLERGRALGDEHPMKALPYFVAARADGMESGALRMLFAQVSRSVPLVTLVGHTSAVTAAAFSSNGTRVVTASRDGTARVWDATTGKPVTVPLEHQGAVTAAAFSPDGTRVVTASEDKTARVWDATTGKPVTAPLEHLETVTAAAFSSDGTRVVTASDHGTARVWDAVTSKPVTASLVHRKENDVILPDAKLVTTAAFSPDGTRVVTTCGNTARVWDAATGEPMIAPFEHQKPVTAAVFSPDGTRVVTASDDYTARVWNTATGKPVTPLLQHRKTVRAFAFSPDGTRVITASSDNTVRVWDAGTGELVTARLENQKFVAAAAFSPDGTRVVTAGGNTARVWDVVTGKPVTEPLEHWSEVVATAFSSDGTRVVTASDGIVRVWDATMGKPVTMRFEHLRSVAAAAFSPDGTRVVTASWDNAAQVWDAMTGRPVTPPLDHQDSVIAAEFSSDGTRVVTASYDNTARVWDAATGKPVTAPFEHQGWVGVAAFSPDGTRVVTASWDKTARVWNTMTGRPVTPPLEHRGGVNAAAFSPDGTRVVTASWDKTARVWNTMTGRPVTPPIEHRGGVNAAAFSPDGARVVTASWDKTARVWDAATGKPMTAPLEHQEGVRAAAFSADGTRVVTASEDKTARVWDARTGKPVTAPLEHQGPVVAAAFSADGTWVVTASGDKTARVWDARTGKPVTAPLEHEDWVTGAAFSADGTRVVTASEDRTARVWTISVELGSLDDWRSLARCSPFALINNALLANRHPPSVCTATMRGFALH